MDRKRANSDEEGPPEKRHKDLEGEARCPHRIEEQLWTLAQRQSNSLHEFSYFACFKAELPRFFIERYAIPGDVVYDPFMGRGTTLIEAALLGCVPFGSDINPLSRLICAPRLDPPTLEQVAQRLDTYDLTWDGELDEDLLVFYHPDTLREICAARARFLTAGDSVDAWIRMCVLARLTGHSSGYLSVSTMPPNAAVSVTSQRNKNARLGLVPEYRSLKTAVLKKTKALLADVTDEHRAALARVRENTRIECAPADSAPFPDTSVDLVITSPPFLAAVDYAAHNWLRCWFVGIDAKALKITRLAKPAAWAEAMTAVLRNLTRVLKPTGHIAFEVGEVRGPKGALVKLDEIVESIAPAAGLEVARVYINTGDFVKTSGMFTKKGAGTNTNRIVLMRKKCPE